MADNHIIPGLVFADDICLTADSLEDLQEMLDICQTWAEEYGMSFNTGKSELMQLAGKIPDEPQETPTSTGGTASSRAMDQRASEPPCQTQDDTI